MTWMSLIGLFLLLPLNGIAASNQTSAGLLEPPPQHWDEGAAKEELDRFVSEFAIPPTDLLKVNRSPAIDPSLDAEALEDSEAWTDAQKDELILSQD